MDPPSFLRRKKKEEKVKERAKEKAKPEEKTPLEQLCGEDSELYEALSRTILINPAQALGESIDSYAQKASEFEEKGNLLRAKIMYGLAGQVALYEGRTDQVQAFFKKCAEIETSPGMKNVYEFYTKKKNLDRAVKVAKEYYARTSSSTEKRE